VTQLTFKAYRKLTNKEYTQYSKTVLYVKEPESGQSCDICLCAVLFTYDVELYTLAIVSTVVSIIQFVAVRAIIDRTGVSLAFMYLQPYCI